MMSGNYSSIDNQNVSGYVPAVSDRHSHVAVKFTDSSLQTFTPARAHGKIYAASGPPRDADDTFSKPVSGSDEPQQNGWFQSFTIAAYRPYFDVDTSDVLERIRDSLFPFRGSFSEKTASSPDLYGPFWICTTLIFVAASIGTFVTYIAHKLQKKEWDYDINLVTWSAAALSVWLLPVYLHSCSVFVGYPSGDFPWVIAGVAGFVSASFVALNLRIHIKSAGESWFLIVTALFLLQLALALALKFYLFTVTM
ncbi:Integral membrane Yip1 family protein [Striga hermonthica]|uniref:Integral membrane Yip1 family protein n=1 Tax=Striga hermonthica TaxID=68872 RepID=A0A9N7NUF8_STRHE|nr:Integral membrane Yip1 family protein [Striga hermonthica]